MIENIKNTGINPKAMGTDKSTSNLIGSSSGNATDAPANASAEKDYVQISAGAQKLDNIQKSILSTPEIDEAKVEKIKTAIAKGEYKIDAGNLAKRMLSSFGNDE